MQIAVFSAKRHDQEFLEPAAHQAGVGLHWIESRLSPETAVLAQDFPAICAFVNDRLDAEVLERLVQGGTRLIALRCAGYNNVDVAAAGRLGIRVARVPAYSPHAVAEHTVGLMLALNRKLHKAYNRVREGNFSLDGLLGFDVQGRTVGIVGTGQIGSVVARILHGFSCRVLLHDVVENEACRQLGEYVELETLLRESNIITLHCPLVPQTKYLIDKKAIALMKKNVMLINTSRGGLIDTSAVIQGLKTGTIGYLGLDVYEEEEALFFEDLSNQVIADDVFSRLLTFPNVLITGHQGFFTREAMLRIAEVTMENIVAWRDEQPIPYEVTG